MNEPVEAPAGGELLPTSILNWYQVRDFEAGNFPIERAFANPVSQTVLTVERTGGDSYVVNVLPYNDWDTVVHDIGNAESVADGIHVALDHAEENTA